MHRCNRVSSQFRRPSVRWTRATRSRGGYDSDSTESGSRSRRRPGTGPDRNCQAPGQHLFADEHGHADVLIIASYYVDKRVAAVRGPKALEFRERHVRCLQPVVGATYRAVRNRTKDIALTPAPIDEQGVTRIHRPAAACLRRSGSSTGAPHSVAVLCFSKQRSA